MKRNKAALIFIVTSCAYLANISLTVTSLKTTPDPMQQLQPLPPKVNRLPKETELLDRRLNHDSRNSSNLSLPIYTNEMAIQAIRPAPWTCGNRNDSELDPLTNQKPMFAFIHIYKTAGSTMRSFFQTYAYICRKGWMCLQRCTEVTSTSVQSNRNWKNCEVEHAVNRDHLIEKYGVRRKLYRHVNNTVLNDHFDLFGGHTRIGAGDYILKTSSADNYPVRHIVFLRDSIDRYISGVLYQNQKKKKGWHSADFANLVKERVLASRSSGEHWDRCLSYLLTPGQAEEINSLKSKYMKTHTADQFAEMKAVTAINNLMKYNVIVGMTEHMPQSMEILKHVLMANSSVEQRELLDKQATNKTLNVSKKGTVSTSSVREELEKDREFMSAFEEYVKYEKMINDYAMTMHLKQYGQLKK